VKKGYDKPIAPDRVYSPRDKIRGGSIKVLKNDESLNFSIVSLDWKNGDNNEFEPRIGIRWNGGKNNCGQPQSHGFPTWFILPKDIALSYAVKINDYEMVEIIKCSADTGF
jgi:hypothetical protein